jgi:molybdopterin-guanine dinucleotide biosynthesis protein A
VNLSDVSLLVLAGGESRRMGFPKHLLRIGGGTVLDCILDRLGCHFGETIVAGRNLCSMRSGVRTIEDCRTERTPLVGILTGLEAARSRFVFAVACDMPFVEPALARLLASRATRYTDAVVPVIRGFFEPLCAIYGVSATAAVSRCLDAGLGRVTAFYGSARVTTVPEEEIRRSDPGLRSFVNLNTPRDCIDLVQPS